MEEFQLLLGFSRKKDLYSVTNFRILKPWTIISNLIRFEIGFVQAWKPFYSKMKYREKVLEEFRRLPGFPRKKVLHSSTKFYILKRWGIISNLRRCDLGFWQASKPFYRKLKNNEKVLEEFQCLPRFPIKTILYSSRKFCILNPWAIISKLVRFDLGFWQASKPFYRKLKDREKVLEEFQRLPRFSRRMVLYSSTNFRILKPGDIISNFVRFDLGFWQASKAFYRKLKNRENVLEEFQRLPRFARKIVFLLSTNFFILNPRTIISNLIRSNLGFCQASKPFYSKLKYQEKVLEEFQLLPRFPRRMVLYSSTNFRILNLSAVISNLIRFDLGFWQASKSFYSKIKYREMVLEEFQRLDPFPRNIVFLLSTNFCIFNPWAIISNLIRLDLGFDRLQNQFRGNSNIGRRFWKNFNVSLAFPEKLFCVPQTIFAF